MSIKNSKGVNKDNSNGINRSDSINRSNGINWSDGINRSNGINESYGIFNSYGVDNALFLADKEREYSIFGVKVSEDKFEKVKSKLQTTINGWHPKFNNAFELYIKSGNDWSKVKASDICDVIDNWEEPYKAWKDMPKEAIDYIKSLDEFDANMFKRITGIDVNTKTEELTMEEVCKELGRVIKIKK